MRNQPCPSCGAKAGRGLPRCPSCGASLDLEVEPFSPDLDGPASTEVELGRRPSRWWAVGAVVGVVGLLGAGALAAGGRSTRAIDTTTTTSVEPSTTVTPSTTRVPRSTTTSTVPEAVREAGVAVAPVLDPERTTGTVLYALSSRQDLLWRVDLRTGAAVIRRIDGPGGLGRVGDGMDLMLMPRTGGVVVAAPGQAAVFVPDDPAAPMAQLTSNTFSSYVMPHGDRSLLWRVTDGPTGMRAVPIDLAGDVAGAAVETAVGYPVGDDGTGRLLIAFADATYAVGPDGAARRLTSSPIVTVERARVVLLECAEDALRCDAVVRLVSDGSEVGRVPLSSSTINSGWAGTLSPAGTTLAVFDGQDSQVLVQPLDGGASWEFSFAPQRGFGYGFGWVSSPLTWADEQTLCGLVDASTLRCWRAGADPFDVLAIDDESFLTLVLGDG